MEPEATCAADRALRPRLGLDHELLDVAWSAARDAGALLLAGRGQDLSVTTKTTRTDVVTQMDTAAEELVMRTILAARPDDALLGEEGGGRAGRTGVRWVVDPLDGTVNYLYGLPGWAVSVAAQVDSVTQVAVIDIPRYGETFAAVRGQGTVCVRDGAVVRPRPGSAPDLGQSLVATGFGYDPVRRSAQARTLATVLPRVRDIRRAGAAAIDLCWASAGLVDCYYERGLQPWDLAAGLLVATEAGLAAGGPPGQQPSGDLVWLAPQHLARDFEALLVQAGAHLG